MDEDSRRMLQAKWNFTNFLTTIDKVVILFLIVSVSIIIIYSIKLTIDKISSKYKRNLQDKLTIMTINTLIHFF